MTGFNGFAHLNTADRTMGSATLLFEHCADAYAYEVFSCEKAANARRVSLAQELKHLLLDTSDGYCLAHVRGDARLSLRRVKRHLNVAQAYLADLASFPNAALERGTVCPFIEPLWSLPHLIDRSVLSMSSMTTNDGTTRGYVHFDPRILCLAPRHETGDFTVA